MTTRAPGRLGSLTTWLIGVVLAIVVVAVGVAAPAGAVAQNCSAGTQARNSDRAVRPVTTLYDSVRFGWSGASEADSYGYDDGVTRVHDAAGQLSVSSGEALATKDAVATTHPVTGVEMRDGFPVFEPQHDFALGPDLVDASDYRQMSAATRDLRATLEKNPTRWRQFTSEQQDAIRAGNDRIPDYTWHHHEDGDTLQLVDRWTHSKTGHDGGRAITGTCR